MISKLVKSLITALAILLLPLAVLAKEAKPFPQQFTFKNCIKPSHITQEKLNASVIARFNSYKSKYLRTAKNTLNGYYIEAKGNGVGGATSSTISEAHGYGMIIFALMAGYDSQAKEIFDGMYYFYKDHPSKGNSYNMSWVIDGNESFEKEYSATDGDMDIAYGLLLADEQWGSEGDINYKQEALRLIYSGIKGSDIGSNTKRIMLGDWSSDEYDTRSSDWMTGHLHAFYKATGDKFWTEAADTVYSLIHQMTKNSNTGLVSDFITGVSPVPDPDAGGTGEHNAVHYSYNACRYPLRIAADFAHFGTPEAAEATGKLLSWLRSKTGGSVSSIRAGYTLTGSPLNNYSDLVFNAPFAAGAITDSDNQEFLNDLWDQMKNNDGYNEYAHALNLLSMLLISGNWWAPGQDASQEEVVAYNNFTAKSDMQLVNNSLRLSGLSEGNVAIKLYSLRGELLYEKNIENRGSLLTHELPYSTFSDNFCILRVEGAGVKLVKKVIVSQ